MIPAARIQAVIELLEKIAASRIPMDSTVGDYMRFRKYIGSKDRADIVERVYALARARARLGWWLGQAGAADTARNRVIAGLTVIDGRDLAEIDSLFNGTKYGPTALDDNEKNLIAALHGHKLDDDKVPEAVRVECPPEAEERLRALFGKDFRAEMAAMLPPATLDLRVNVFRIGREDAQKKLREEGIETEITPYSPWGLRCRTKAFLSESKLFRDGLIEIQDEGSQLIALACGVDNSGLQVLDYCAGAGGKTLALAAAMGNKGRIVAMDSEPARLEKARGRFRRAGAHDIIEVRPLTDEKSRKWLRRQKGTFDVVLADVPCSGSGTWRRNPDMRWRQYGPALNELLNVQDEILDRVAGTVKPGGRLVYATCSLFREENEDRIAAFCARHPYFRTSTLDIVNPAESFMRLSPRRHNTDGFFAALLTRVTDN